MGWSKRQQALVFPREHGAWGMLLVPLATGAAVGLLEGGRALPLAPFTAAVLALFWLRTPVESWAAATPVRAQTAAEFRLVRRASLVLGMVALAALAAVFWGGRHQRLLWIGGAAAVAFLVQALVKKTWRQARAGSQMVGAAGLSAVAPAAYYLATGGLTLTAWSLWAANFLFAVNQIQFVQLRIHAARPLEEGKRLALGRGFLSGQIMLMALLAAAIELRVLSGWACLAFVPVLARGFAWFGRKPEPLAIRRVGITELGYAAGFGLLLILGFHFG